jgi:UDP-3-O-[3-hydroxymyristoyl] glucosamine N-acyltransferase
MTQSTLSELATLTRSQLIGDPHHVITGVESLEAARSHEAAFLENPRYTKQVVTTQAGVIFVSPNFSLLSGHNYLVTDHPSYAFQKVIDLFIPPLPSGFMGIHPTAVVHPSASLAEGVTIGPYAVIDARAHIGPHTTLGPSVCIGASARVGAECFIHSHVTIREGCVIGNRVIIQPGAVIGSCGFGYFTDQQGKHIFLPQRGKVVIEDDVEIGANTTIDRPRFNATRIRRGTKIDNLVQIGHQVEVGEDNLIVAQVGIAGSTTTGRHVVIGGQVGIAGHLEITDNVMLAACSAVSKSLLESDTYMGIPAVPAKEFKSHFFHLRNIGKLSERLKQLEAKLHELQDMQGVRNPD